MILCIAILVLLVLVPLHLHSNVSTILKDTAAELHEAHWAAPFAGFSLNKPATTAVTVPPNPHEDPSLTNRCSGAMPVYDAQGNRRPVSYTHLTLPTICSV